MLPPDLADIQGNVLRAYGTRYTHARYGFLAVVDAPAARGWLARHAAAVTSNGEGGEDGPPTTLNVAFTWEGLAALGMPQNVLDAFPPEFRAGAHGRAADLRDVGPSAPATWDTAFGQAGAHVLVAVHARASAPRADDARAVLERGWAALVPGSGDGLALHGEPTDAALLPGADPLPDIEADGRSCTLRYTREHFGFADGCSQPAVADNHVDPEGGGTLVRDRAEGRLFALLSAQGRLATAVGRRTTFPLARWEELALGEFVLGHRNEDGDLAALRGAEEDPSLAALGANGTFMVLRKLAQHVERFRAATSAWADGDEEATRRLQARMVGRWHDGTPLALRPDAPDPVLAADGNRANRFAYGLDPEGQRCPLGAHVRRVNPRDAMPGGGSRTKRHRIIRRGMPYGEWLPDGGRDEDPPARGLAFVCLQASIARQFEVIQDAWCNDGDALGLGAEPDVLIRHAQGPANFVLGSRPPRVLPNLEPFVSTRGAAYLFLPGRRALSHLLETAARGG